MAKLLSEDPDNYDDAPREGIRRILEDVTGQSFDPEGWQSKLYQFPEYFFEGFPYTNK